MYQNKHSKKYIRNKQFGKNQILSKTKKISLYNIFAGILFFMMLTGIFLFGILFSWIAYNSWHFDHLISCFFSIVALFIFSIAGMFIYALKHPGMITDADSNDDDNWMMSLIALNTMLAFNVMNNNCNN